MAIEELNIENLEKFIISELLATGFILSFDFYERVSFNNTLQLNIHNNYIDKDLEHLKPLIKLNQFIKNNNLDNGFKIKLCFVQDKDEDEYEFKIITKVKKLY